MVDFESRYIVLGYSRERIEIVIHQLIGVWALRQRYQSLNFQGHGIHLGCRHCVVREGIADNLAIVYSLRAGVVYSILENRPAERVSAETPVIHRGHGGAEVAITIGDRRNRIERVAVNGARGVGFPTEKEKCFVVAVIDLG